MAPPQINPAVLSAPLDGFILPQVLSLPGLTGSISHLPHKFRVMTCPGTPLVKPHRIPGQSGLEGISGDHPVQPPCPTLELVTQERVQLGLELSPERLHPLPGHPELCHPHGNSPSRKFFIVRTHEGTLWASSRHKSDPGTALPFPGGDLLPQRSPKT